MAFDKGRALVIGVGTYLYVPGANIPISVADAKAVRDVLCDGNLCGYPPEQVTLLHDDGASREGILGALDTLADSTKAENTVFLYYCGHGEYGTDGNYTLTTHDAWVSGGKVAKGTGISEGELLDKLRAIPVKRLLLIFNACHSGEISPDLGMVGEGKAFGDLSLPPAASDAILSAGEGRVIITASRPEQKSWIGSGKLTIFTQALVDGLRGGGYVANKGGYVSAFGLYEHVYLSVKEAAARLHRTQEPELTVLRGVGPFPVSLYRGATDLGTFDSGERLPERTAARQVDPARSQRLFQNKVRTVTASGAGAVAVGRDVRDSTIITGSDNVVIRGGVDTGGSFVGRDKVVRGDEVHGDKVAGDKTDVGDISGSTGVAIGRGAQATVSAGLSSQEIDRLFLPLMAALREAPPDRRDEALQAAQALRGEVAKGEDANDTRMAKLLDGLVELVPGAVSAVVIAFASPVLGGIVGPVTKYALERIRGR